jgi:hypothetical protein
MQFIAMLADCQVSSSETMSDKMQVLISLTLRNADFSLANVTKVH